MMSRHNFLRTWLPGLALAGCAPRVMPSGPAAALWEVPPGVQSRAVTFENPTGAPGAGGQAASPLGTGRKGAPARMIAAGETVTLCDLAGPGVIRHIWMTTLLSPEVARAVTIRAWWDDQPHPAIECPLGDFFGIPHGRVMPYESAVHATSDRGGLNLFLPMPFARRARIDFVNESRATLPLYMQVDYTIGDRLPARFGRLHVAFRRENPTRLAEDFTLLPARRGEGRFLGAVMSVRVLDRKDWWGEGEMKAYLDGDTRFPTIAGTGAEDYILQAFGTAERAQRFAGVTLDRDGFVGMYRWHLPDPVYWHREARVTIQQIGSRMVDLMKLDFTGKTPQDFGSLYFERSDDWAAAAFWYEPVPSAPLPPYPALADRTRDLPAVPGVLDSLLQQR